MKILKKIILIALVIFIMIVVFIISFFAYNFSIKYKLKFPYSRDSLLVWKLDEPGKSVTPSSFILDSNRKIIINSFTLDKNSHVQNKLFTDNCKQEYLWSCIFFIDTESGKLKHSIRIEGGIFQMVDTKDYLYSAISFSEIRNGRDGSKIIKINKDTYEIAIVWDGDTSISRLKTIDKYISFEEHDYSSNNFTDYLYIINTVSGKVNKYPLDNKTNILQISYEGPNKLKIFTDQESYFLYDIDQNQVLDQVTLSKFEQYKYLYNNVVSKDSSTVFYTDGIKVGAINKDEVLWEVSLHPEGEGSGEIPRIDDKPYVDENNVYVATQFRQFYSLDKKTGKTNWVIDIPTSVGRNFEVYKNKAYFANFGFAFQPSGLGIIDLEKGKLVHLEQPAGASDYWHDYGPIISPPYVYLQNDYSGIYEFRLVD